MPTLKPTAQPMSKLPIVSLIAALLTVGCAQNMRTSQTTPSQAGTSNGMSHDMSGHGIPSAASTSASGPNDPTLPPDAVHAVARLNTSTRHGQYVMIPTAKGDSIRAWIVYPERSTKAPVIVVVHEIFGMSSWIRSVTDQLAADGFIAIAPDFLTNQNLPGAPDSVSLQAGVAAVSKLDMNDVQNEIDAAAKYAMALPSALPRYGIVGFCWGGGVSFMHAVHSPTLGASVVYYGTSPKTEVLPAVKAPVLGLYGANDARVVMTIAQADSAIKAMGKTYNHEVFAGATHGFLRQQDGGANGANLAATMQAWPATVAWFHNYLGS
ncbi:MAG: dienelactone hydrolase family protein [Gemmatimonadaceae bacterium]